MGTTKFSFVINEMGNDLYAIIMTSWTVDLEGNKIQGKSKTESSVTLEKCLEFQNDFITENS